ncbi:hypothetical protein VaNZ11_011655 [Volvox africanus]|uniref:Guanylate cyclase domain-containing protein n=1 Tax=Volvox africanus TaxID=51714 RepID=A0ABQ5SBZ7_9CHLO|nr:hypothetical protein VaNZ11_011655 [Volvox africanus]
MDDLQVAESSSTAAPKKRSLSEKLLILLPSLFNCVLGSKADEVPDPEVADSIQGSINVEASATVSLLQLSKNYDQATYGVIVIAPYTDTICATTMVTLTSSTPVYWNDAAASILRASSHSSMDSRGQRTSDSAVPSLLDAFAAALAPGTVDSLSALLQRVAMSQKCISPKEGDNGFVDAHPLPTEVATARGTRDSASLTGAHLQTLDMEPVLLLMGSAAPEPLGGAAAAAHGSFGNGSRRSHMHMRNDGGNNHRRPSGFPTPVQEQKPSCYNQTTFSPARVFAGPAKKERSYQIDAPCTLQPAVIVAFSVEKPNGGVLLHCVDDPTTRNAVPRTGKPWPAALVDSNGCAASAGGDLANDSTVIAPTAADHRLQQSQQQSGRGGGSGSAPQVPANSSVGAAAPTTIMKVLRGSDGGNGNAHQVDDDIDLLVPICEEAGPESSNCDMLHKRSPSSRHAAAAPDDEGDSLWLRREGLVLSALTHMVTAMVTAGCATVLYQNAPSQSYYGRRSAPKPRKAPSPACPQDDLADGSEAGCIDSTSGTFLLTQLFSLQPAKLERMLADVMGEARIWKGILQVPVSMKLATPCSYPAGWNLSQPLTNQASSTPPWAVASGAPTATTAAVIDAGSSSVEAVTSSTMPGLKAVGIGRPNSSLASRSCSTRRVLQPLDSPIVSLVQSAAFTSKGTRRLFSVKPAGDGTDIERISTPLSSEAIRIQTSNDFLIPHDETPNAMMEASTKGIQNSMEINPLATSTWGLMLDTMEDNNRVPVEVPNRQLNSSHGRCNVDALASRNGRDVMAGFAAKAPGVAAAAAIATPTCGSVIHGSPTRSMRAPVVPSNSTARRLFRVQDNGVLGFITESQLPYDINGRSNVYLTAPSPAVFNPNPEETCQCNTDASGRIAEMFHQDIKYDDIVRRTKSMLALSFGSTAGVASANRMTSDDTALVGTPRRCITRADLHGQQGRGLQCSFTRVLAFASSLKNTPSALQQALAVRGTNVPGVSTSNGIASKQIFSLPNADFIAVNNGEGGQNGEAAKHRIESYFAPGELRHGFLRTKLSHEFLSSSSTLQPLGCPSGALAPQIEMMPQPAVTATSTASAAVARIAEASATGAPHNHQNAGAQGEAVPATAAVALSARTGGRRLAAAAAATLTVAISDNVTGNRVSVGRQEQLQSSPANNNAGVTVSVCGTSVFAVGSSMPSATSTTPLSCIPVQVHSSSYAGGTTVVSGHGIWRAAVEAAARGTASSRSRSPLGQMTAAATAACWHEITAIRTTDPVSGQDIIVLVQSDVTDKVEAERHLARVAEAEHRLLEKIFPRHVLTYMMTEEGVLLDNGPPSSRLGNLKPAPLIRDINKLATSHSEVTLLFADIQGFTPMCQMLEPQVVMAFLNDLFTCFDNRLEEFGVYKVETIGDCYFVAGGLIHEDEHGMPAVRARDSHADPLHAEKVFMFAKAMLAAASEVALPTSGCPVRMRIGIHTGPVVSGVVGQRMPRFCLFGDTVNTASRMESTGVPGCIHASEAVRRLLSHESWVPMGNTEVKGKGLMNTYLWVPPEHHLHGTPRQPSAASRHACPNGSTTEAVSISVAAAAAAAAASSATASGTIGGSAGNPARRLRQQQISVARASSRWGGRGSGGSGTSALTGELDLASSRGTAEEGSRVSNAAHSGGGFAQVCPPRLSSDSATESVEGLAKLLLDGDR